MTTAAPGWLKARMDTSVSIYAIESDSGDEVYIGATATPLQVRLARHICESYDLRDRVSPKHLWIRKHIGDGSTLKVVELENVATGDDWGDVERFWIESLRATGVAVLNETNGGLGHRGRTLSAEHREKIAASHRGKKCDPEQMRRLQAAGVAANRGKKRSEETKRKISAAHKGKKRAPLSPEHRAALSRSLTRFHSKEG